MSLDALLTSRWAAIQADASGPPAEDAKPASSAESSPDASGAAASAADRDSMTAGGPPEAPLSEGEAATESGAAGESGDSKTASVVEANAAAAARAEAAVTDARAASEETVVAGMPDVSGARCPLDLLIT